MLTNRLCNPTPFLVEWPYDKGVVIKLDADGHQDLMDVEMSNQFRPGLPGTEAVRECMEQFGIFLRDTTVPYEVQAIKALKDCIKFHEGLYKDTTASIRRKAPSIGLNSELAIQQTLEQMGYDALLEKVNKLKSRLAKYESKVDKSVLDRPLHKQYDPKRTLLFTNPPREFESEIAMQVFLEENGPMRARYEAWMKQFEKAEVQEVVKVKPKKSDDNG